MAVMTAIAIGSLIVAGVSAYKQHQAQKQAGDAAKEIGDFNAAVAEAQAVDASRRGEEDVSAFRRQVRSLIGTQRAGYAGQNVEVSSGSAADVQADARRLAASDIERLRRNAEREAQGFKDEAQNARMGGEYARRAARNQANATLIGAGADIGLAVSRYGWGGKD